jgi:NitT/TauT family transport system substrate-binding protein
MKKFGLIIVLLIGILTLSACTAKKEEPVKENTQPEATVAVEPTEEAEAEVSPAPTIEPVVKTDIKIAALKGPTAIGMVKIMEDAAADTTANHYEFTIAGTADEISAGLLKGDFDIAAIPCNLAAVLFNKTQGKLKLAGINTLGVLYIIETGDGIKTVEDLRGRTIYSTGLGTTPQYTLNYLLSAYGLDPEKDVTIEYKTEATEVAALLSEAEDAVAMLPQPYVTTVMMNNEKVRIALDVAKEWEAVNKDGSSVVTGVVVVRSDFLESNKDAVDAFLTEYTNSAAFVNENIEEASALVEKFDIFKAAVIKKAIPYCNITLIQGEEMKLKVNGYLNALFEQNPKAVGGVLPTEDFYYMP